MIFQDEVDKAVRAAERAAADPKADKAKAEAQRKKAEELAEKRRRQGWLPPPPLMRAARVWADHYYRCADQLVGISVICSLWVLTVLLALYLALALALARARARAQALALALALALCPVP